MKKYIIFGIVLILCVLIGVYKIFFNSSFLSTESLRVDSMKELEIVLERADKDTLVVFDVDMVMTQPKEPAFQMPNLIKYKDILKEKIDTLTPEKADMLFCSMLLEKGTSLLDEKIPDLLKKLQKKGVSTIALTAVLTGKVGPVKDMVEWRHNQFNQLGINFLKNAPSANRFFSVDFPFYNQTQPVYAQGVLFSNGERGPVHKGLILESFLGHIDTMPTCIIVIDDNKKNLTKIEESLRSLQYQGHFIPIEFTLALKKESQFVSAEVFESKIDFILNQIN